MSQDSNNVVQSLRISPSLETTEECKSKDVNDQYITPTDFVAKIDTIPERDQILI